MAQALATVLVAVIGLIGIIIQNKSHSRLKDQEDLLKIVDEKVDSIKHLHDEDNKCINNKLDSIDMDVCKRFLIMELTNIKEGVYTPTEEQKRMLHETKERYNNDGGDSYVDSLFEEVHDKGLI